MKDLLELLVDDAPEAAAWPLDRALQFGDGLFETMRVVDGCIRFEELHRLRLAEGCRRLAIDADLARCWDGARRLAARHGDALLRLQVSRGSPVMRGYAPTGRERARCILAAFAIGDAGLPRPLRVLTLANRLGENPDLAGLKHCNRLEQVIARQALAGTGAFEGLQASSSGLLVSGTMSNVFLELDGELVTPAMDRCGVAGVMRAAVLQEAARLRIPVRIAQVPFADVARASAVALSNARMGLAMVDELDGRPLLRDARLATLADGVGAP
jgi:4-amino-4-deoxychorismate lyase